MQNLYNINITGSSSAAPSDGFIDNMTISQYIELGDAGPTTAAAGLAKARANYRFKLLCQSLSLMGNIYVTNMTPAGGDCNTAPSSFAFTATVEHGEDSIYVYDETNNMALLTGIPALVRMCARALIASETCELLYIDPTTSNAPGNATAFSRVGPRVATETIGPVAANLTLAAAMVTVYKIA